MVQIFVLLFLLIANVFIIGLFTGGMIMFWVICDFIIQ